MGQGGPVVQSHPRRPAGGISTLEVDPGAQRSPALRGVPIPSGHPVVVRAASTEAVHPPREISRLQEFLIRTVDITGAVLILLMTLPVSVVFSVLIKVSSPGPLLYTQERVGRRGKVFALYKFRSMVPDAEKKVGPVWASQQDDRVTPVGGVMRRMRIDELPQLINVVKGDMSLVGPRPERPFFVDRYEALQGVRLAVRPGLTGLAQIRGFYDLRPERKLRYDTLYIRNRSLWLNLSILLKTLPVVIRKTGW